jgi:hypothetical protein
MVGLAVLTLVAEAAETGPLFCLVDDAQWLDEASAQILAFVARRLLAERVALVCVARTGDQVLAEMPALPIRGMGDDDARVLLRRSLHGSLDPDVIEQIIAECRGNPLALVELPRTWGTAGLAGGFGLPNVYRSPEDRRELPAAAVAAPCRCPAAHPRRGGGAGG